MRPTAVLVEDEPLAREKLRGLLQELDLVQLVGEAATAAEAIGLIDALTPDILFLDIEMPGMTGVDLLDEIEHEPAVIFTTAHADYAVTAFELAAVDYLLKPFGLARLREAVERAIRSSGGEEAAAGAGRRTRDAMARDRPLRRVFVRQRGSIVPLPVDDIERLEAEGDYVALYAGGQRHLIRSTLRDMEERLSPDHFLRIHRSHLVNLNHVRALEPYDGSRFAVVMRDGTRIVASRAHSSTLRELIG